MDKEKLVAFTQALVQAPSLSGEEAHVAARVREEMERLGFDWVTIDENGSVISASAVSGHPLLKQAAEQAARSSKFSPTLLSGQKVKVSGLIVYNFTAQ